MPSDSGTDKGVQPDMSAKDQSLATSSINSADRKKNFAKPSITPQDHAAFLQLVDSANTRPDIKTADEVPPVSNLLGRPTSEPVTPLPVKELQARVDEVSTSFSEGARKTLAEAGISVEDAISLSTQDRGDSADFAYVKRGRKKTKTEKTYSLEPDMHKLLGRLARSEGMRLDKFVSASEVVRQFILLGLTLIENDEVIPTEDGRGLHIGKFVKKTDTQANS